MPAPVPPPPPEREIDDIDAALLGDLRAADASFQVRKESGSVSIEIHYDKGKRRKARLTWSSVREA